MDSETLKFNLLFGLPIKYENINIFQPTIEDYINLPMHINGYYLYKYLFCIRLEHLNIGDDLKNILKKEHKSLFESFFICDELLKQQNKLTSDISLVLQLIYSLSFFLRINIDCFQIDGKNQQIIITDKEKNEELFILNNDNFEEISAFIRLICSSEIIEIEVKNNNIKYPKDETLRKTMEKLLKQNAETEARKKKENATTLVDIMLRVLAHEDRKYNYFSLSKLTIWQLLKEYENMYIRENFDFEKRKITSGNFDYSKVKVDLDWGKKTKIKLPEILKTN
jgi:hypothetical protein